MKIIIDKRATKLEVDAGKYPITVELITIIKGAQMPPRKYELMLTIGQILPPVPVPPLKAPADG